LKNEYSVWRPSSLTITALVIGLVLLLAGAFVAGYVPLQKRDATVRAEADERARAVPSMEVIRVGRAAGESDIQLPGTMQAITEAPILARADGYLKRRLVDIGDRVITGQVLAEIDAPELDQQIKQVEASVAQAEAASEQAEANLEQGKANRDLARLNAERWKSLADQGIASKQDSDQYQSQFAAQNANVQALEKAITAQRSNVAAAKANLSRLQEIQGYRLVKAPFDGVVTVRSVDVGALVNTGSTLLFRIAQIDKLRTYINVPQMSASSVRTGQPAVLTVANLPGRVFHGNVARTANALDPANRTMLVEVAVPNPDGALFPGSFAEVNLSASRTNLPLIVPASAILFRTDGAQVAVVQPDTTLHLQKIVVGRDYGDRVEILQGLDDGATILAAPGDAAREGVKIVPVDVEQPR